MDLKVEPQSIEQRLRRKVLTKLNVSASRWRYLKLALSILSGLLIGGAQIWLASAEDVRTDLPTAMWVIGLVLFSAVAIVQFFDDRGDSDILAVAEEAIMETNQGRQRTRDLEEGLKTFDSRLRFVSRLYQHHVALSETVENTVANPIDRKGRIQVSSKLLELLLQDKQTLFGIGGDENWNFAVYLFSNETSDLECVVCRRANKYEEAQRHRRWKSGDGHVGTAYQNRKELVCEDTKEPNVAAFFDAPPGQKREYDSGRYRSIASVPIIIGEKNCVGVVVATSDQIGRFRPYGQTKSDENDTVEPVRLLAKTIALIESAAYIRSNGAQNG